MSSSECPICLENFPASAIERHASTCEGKRQEVKASDTNSTPTRSSPWSGFKRRRSYDVGNGGGGEKDAPKAAKIDQKEEQHAEASVVNRKDWFLAFENA